MLDDLDTALRNEETVKLIKTKANRKYKKEDGKLN